MTTEESKIMYSNFANADEERSQTNADLIRNMSDEKLSGFLCRFRGSDRPCTGCVAEKYCRIDHNGMIDWLQEPAND